MQFKKNRALALMAVIALAACSGKDGAAGANGSNGANGANGTNGVNGTNGTNGVNGTDGQDAFASSTEQCLVCHGPNEMVAVADMHGTRFNDLTRDGLYITVTGVTGGTTASDPVVVAFTMKDKLGRPIDVAGVYSQNQVFYPRFSLSNYTIDGNGNVSPYTVLTTSGTSPNFSPTSYNPDPAQKTSKGTAQPASGTLTQTATQGAYTYAFPVADVLNPDTSAVVAKAVAYADTSKTHVVWIQASRQMNLNNAQDGTSFATANVQYNYSPATGLAVNTTRAVVDTAGCNACHRTFRPDANGVSAAFHGGGRINGNYCNVCHNPDRKSTASNSYTGSTDTALPAADSNIFVHRIHNGENLQSNNVFHGINEVTYPQDIRNCKQCHPETTQGKQAYTNPSKGACGSCHDYVDFSGSTTLPVCTHPPAKDANGVNATCEHVGYSQADVNCKACHTESIVRGYHLTVSPADPTNCWTLNNASGCNNNTNAAWIANAGAVPPNALRVKYVLASTDPVQRNSSKQPTIKFRLETSTDGTTWTPVVFNDPAAKSEMMDNFQGSPSVYFAWAVPQDGVAAPADFNASASGYLRQIWNGKATGTGKGTISAVDSSGFYTVTLTGVTVPDNAVMLTGGVGYTYGLSSTPPLVQTNLAAYPMTTVSLTAGTQFGVACTTAAPCTVKTGGLIVAADDVSKVAKTYTARRPIVDTAKCQTCHVKLGATPTFHAGQRNDGPTCSFCHNPNRTSSGWSANAKDFLHGIHGAAMRTVPFNWHATSATENFGDVTFPGAANDCTACHQTTPLANGAPDATKNTFDFSNAANLAALPNMLWSTAASGSFKTTDSSAFAYSPYVAQDGTAYGAVFSFNAGTGATTPADATTLVTSPITAACVACHDAPTARDHMKANGGSFYAPRTVIGLSGK